MDLCGARGAMVLFEDVSFTLRPGSALLIRGPNGAGKSTLLRILAGLLPPADGAVSFGKGDAELPARHYVGHANAIKQGLSVERHVRFWASFGPKRPECPTTTVDAALDVFNLEALRDLPARYLSAGQKRRLALSRLVASPAALWLLDEPVTALDAASVALFEQAVAAHRRAGGIAVIATHQELVVPDARNLTLGRA